MTILTVNNVLFDNIRDFADSITLQRIITAINAVPNLATTLANASQAGNLLLIVDDARIKNMGAGFFPGENGKPDTIFFKNSDFTAGINDYALAQTLQKFAHEVEHYSTKYEATVAEARLLDTGTGLSLIQRAEQYVDAMLLHEGRAYYQGWSALTTYASSSAGTQLAGLAIDRGVMENAVKSAHDEATRLGLTGDDRVEYVAQEIKGVVAATKLGSSNYLDYYTNEAKIRTNTDFDGELVKNAVVARFVTAGDIANIDVEFFDDGSGVEIVEYTDGHVVRTNRDEDGIVSSRVVTEYSEQGRFETITYADGHIVKLSYDGDGNLLSQENIESGGATLQNAIGQYGGSLLDALSLVKAIQSGEPLPILASGLRLANDLSNLNGITNYNLSGAANAASGILSLLSLDAALERGDTLGAVTAGVQALSFGATAYTEFLIAQNGGDVIGALVENTDAFGFAEVLGDALPYLNLVNSIANGDVAGTAVAALSIVGVPYIGWAYAVYSIIDSLFGGHDEEIPDPWGNGHFTWTGTGISYQSVGETGGNEAVANVMGSVLSTMNALIERERQQNPGAALGIIPNRMPGVGYDMSGYRYTDIDPLTGAEKHPGLRFDTAGRPYNAEAGSPESYQSIVEGMVRSALTRGAIAPLWEVETAKLQTDAGDPKAGLTEEERAGRDGQLAAPIAGATQTFRPVALDLDGDGIETTDKANGVAFDVDDSGYLKATAWVQGDDAFLTLDRDYNGQFDTGRELFSNGTVALGRRGLAGMAWVDSNYDGKLTATDPVWSELKVWRDLDQDGAQDAGESQSLAALGISELNYTMGTFTQNGVKKQLASPDLEADKDGTRVTVVPEGILVQASGNGHLSLLVTRMEDKQALNDLNWRIVA